jgi:hypothetical protein
MIPTSELPTTLVAKKRLQIEPYKAKPAAPQPSQQARDGQDAQQSLPNSEGAEQGVLGAICAEPLVAMPECQRTLLPHFFYNPVHKKIYSVMVDLYRDGKPIDLISFTQELRDRKLLDEVGGAAFVTSLFTSSDLGLMSASNLAYYVDILREKFLLRELISTGTSMVRAAYGQDGEISEVIDSFSSKLELIKQAVAGPNGAADLDLDSLAQFDPLHDPKCLIGRRFLVRGGSWMIAGPTGCGKSSFLMQQAIYWATGTAMFGMKPTGPLKIMIVQAEDDFGDVAEQYQGVVAGIKSLQELDLDQFDQLIRSNLSLKEMRGISGEAFLKQLEAHMQFFKPDLVGINPLFAYAGCDLLDASIGTFLRDKLFVLAKKYNCCLIVMHHVSKPPKERSSAGTLYLGFGSSEIQNSFRAVSTLSPLGDGIYKFDFGKRYNRAGAKNPDGSFADVLYLKHSTEGICWLQSEQPEEEKKGRPKKYSADTILYEMNEEKPMSAGALQLKMYRDFDMPRRVFFRLWDELKEDNKITKKGDGWILQVP